MRKIARFTVVALAVCAASAALASVTRAPVTPEIVLWTWSRNIALANGTDLGGIVLPADPATITAASMKVSIAGGGGGGTTVLTLSDGGGNTCTATFTCAATATPAVYRVAAANGTGNGCRFAPSAVVSGSVSTAGCTTTQPTAITITFHAKR